MTVMSLRFDYGMYSDPLSFFKERPSYDSRNECIGGKNAKIVSFYNPGKGNPFDYAIAVQFPEVKGFAKLTVSVTCKVTNEYEIARTIFRTIKFK